MVFIVTVLVGIAVHIATGNFFTSYNISTLSRAASFAIIVGFGQTIVLLTGDATFCSNRWSGLWYGKCNFYG